MEMRIEKRVIDRYYADITKHGDVFILTGEDGYYELNSYIVNDEGELEIVDEWYARLCGDLDNLVDEQTKIDILRETIREVLIEEINKLKGD